MLKFKTMCVKQGIVWGVLGNFSPYFFSPYYYLIFQYAHI